MWLDSSFRVRTHSDSAYRTWKKINKIFNVDEWADLPRGARMARPSAKKLMELPGHKASYSKNKWHSNHTS